MGLNQNGVVLSFFEPKRRRFGFAIYFFEILHIPKRRCFGQNCYKTAVFLSSFHIPKTTSFWVSDSCFKTMPFCSSFVQNDVVLLFIKKKRRNDVVSPRRLPKNDFPCSSFQFAAIGGEGGGGEDRAGGRWPLVGIEDLT